MSRSSEWYTPAFIVDAARSVFNGKIHVDAASCDAANAVIRADMFYSKEKSALSGFARFYGNVFCNPPAGKVGNRSQVRMFWDMLQHGYRCGDIDQLIFLLPQLNHLQTIQGCSCGLGDTSVCVIRKRVKFWNTGGTGMAPPHGQAILYLGHSHRKFAEAFRDIGEVWHR